MATPICHAETRGWPRLSLGRAGADLAAALLALVTVAVITWWWVGLPAGYLLRTFALYAVLAVLLVRSLPADLPGRGLGPANRVTLGRAALVLPVAALALYPGVLPVAGYWWIIAVSTLGMLLDGVDGWVARRTGTATAFGGRFDMELDAFLLLALSALVWSSGRTGPWVLLIGALRYLFVAAGWRWPALRHELPPSLRRKAICVVQGVALLVCLGPIIPPVLASAGAAMALALLIYSFAVDVRWLLQQLRTQDSELKTGTTVLSSEF